MPGKVRRLAGDFGNMLQSAKLQVVEALTARAVG